MALNKPSLRPLDFQPVHYQGQQMWYLRDPLQLTQAQVIVPQPLAPILIYCDGTRTPEEIHTAFCRHIGQQLPYEIVDQTLTQLDEACLLNNGRFQTAHQHLLNTYRQQPHRPPALADLSYPGRPAELTRLLSNYANGDHLNGWQPWQGRAIVSPHIDYQRGGPVYAKVWRRAQTAVLNADIVLMFGTDHNGGLGTFTLTRQAYATPYGVIPTDLNIVDQVATAIGPEAAYAEELHHRAEHSIELSAVWLHYICQQAGVDVPPMIPILCGSFHHFVSNGAHPAYDNRLNTAVAALQAATQDKQVLAVASVDLAHVGPNFGDHFHMDNQRRTHLQASDKALIQAINQGDAATFYDQIAAVNDQNRICGFSSLYLMLRYLNTIESGQEIAYAHCPADDQDNSLVSICGLLLK